MTGNVPVASRAPRLLDNLGRPDREYVSKEGHVKRFLSFAAVVFWASGVASGAEQTWTGQISDSMCGAKHTMGEADERKCAQGCVGNGSTYAYVLVSGGKVYKFAKQDKELAVHAGHTVNVTGELKGDTITLSKIEMPKKGGSKP